MASIPWHGICSRLLTVDFFTANVERKVSNEEYPAATEQIITMLCQRDLSSTTFLAPVIIDTLYDHTSCTLTD
jgi:hypothetical protein